MPSPYTRKVQSRYAGQATAGSTSKENVFRSPVAGTFRGTLIPDTVLAGAATNFRTVRFMNLGQAGAGTTVMGTKAFSNGVNAPAGDETDITASATASDLVVAEGDVIALDTTVSGTGLALPPGLVVGYFTAA